MRRNILTFALVWLEMTKYLQNCDFRFHDGTLPFNAAANLFPVGSLQGQGDGRIAHAFTGTCLAIYRILSLKSTVSLMS